MNVEDALTRHIPAIGGVHVRSLVGDRPPFENADFLFRADGVIAELKCLDEDRIVDAAVIQAATDLYLQELSSDQSLPIIFGTIHLTTQGRSEAFTRKIASLYEKPIKRLVEKANRQIKNTATALSLRAAKGMLIVANNRHSALDPAHARYLLQRVLKRQTYSSINSVVYVSAEQMVALPSMQQPVDVFFELRRDAQLPIQAEFIARFRQVWYRCLSTERGMDEHHEIEIDEKVFFQIENRRGT